jgi:hypothetical protein
MEAILIWTINDFSAYGMVSDWSTYEKLACMYYMHYNKAFILFNGGKAFFFILTRGSCQVIQHGCKY